MSIITVYVLFIVACLWGTWLHWKWAHCWLLLWKLKRNKDDEQKDWINALIWLGVMQVHTPYNRYAFSRLQYVWYVTKHPFVLSVAIEDNDYEQRYYPLIFSQVMITPRWEEITEIGWQILNKKQPELIKYQLLFI